MPHKAHIVYGLVKRHNFVIYKEINIKMRKSIFFNLSDCLPTHSRRGKKILFNTYLKKEEKKKISQIYLKSTIYTDITYLSSMRNFEIIPQNILTVLFMFIYLCLFIYLFFF